MLVIPYFMLFMFFYFSFLINEDKKKTEFAISLKYFSILYLIIFIGFRGFVSTDWYSYYPFYENLDVWREIDLKYLGSFGWEIGIPFFMFITKKIGLDYFGFCFISSMIDIIVISYFLSKYSKNFYLSLIFFILYGGLTMEFNLLRNCKAIDLFLLSLEFLNKKQWKYFLLNICGYIFHTSAIFFILFFFIYHIDIIRHRKLILWLWIIGLIIYVLKIQYINVFLNSIADFLPGRMRWLIKRYTIFNDKLQSYGFGLGFIERMFSFIFFYKYQDCLIKEDKNNKIFYTMAYFYFFIFLYFAEIFEIVSRLAVFTGFGYWIIFPALFDKVKSKKIFFIILTLYSLLKIYAVFGNDLSLQYENVLFGAQSYNERLINNLKFRL